MRRAQILGTGLYAPERVVPNAYFDELYGEDVSSFLVERRNIRERRYADDDQATSDLVVEAAREALRQSGTAPEALDLIVVATDTPDYLSPSTAAIVQHKLGATGAGTFDLNTACAGFVTALDVANKYVAADDPERPQYRRVLVAGAYLMSRFIDYRQKNTASLFADGAGAVVLGPTDEGGVLASDLETRGEFAEYMGIYVGGAAAPANAERVEAQEHLLQFRQKFPREFNREAWSAVGRRLAERVGVSVDDVDHWVFTQINVESIGEAMEALGQPMDKAVLVMDRFGYTGSACVPMALADADQKGRFRPGDLVFLIASGGGAAIAGLALRWGTSD
ncbi:MAG TPA: ketoacyl-ACP synthase III [Bacteroidetes bacterium]|nr:ketoacyl-ACP synthase III [Bacteroidota bacterium]HIL56931.1 ketoacyl-ACP synthase III [Rhodothermales bacterium]